MATCGHLVVQSGQFTGRLLPLDRPLMTAGRSPENDFSFNGTLVSVRHAEFRQVLRHEIAGPEFVENDNDGERTLLTDLGGSTGTFIDRIRLLPHQPRLLTHGATIRIGEHSLIYHDPRYLARTLNAVGELPQPADEPPNMPDWSNLSDRETRDATAAQVNRLRQPIKPCEAELQTEDSKIRSYLQYLPVIFHENSFLGSFLRIFENIWEPLEQRQDQMALYFDPRTCPDRFLRWMAQWFGLNLHDGWTEARLRALLAEGIEMHRWFGTRYGLERLIEACAGIAVEITEAPRQPFVFQVKLSPMPNGDDLEFIRTLIRDFKPAHTDWVLLEER